MPTPAAGGGSKGKANGDHTELDWRSLLLLPNLKPRTRSALPSVDPNALAQLMADHTALDWRPLLPRITIPCLNVVGRKVGLRAVWLACISFPFVSAAAAHHRPLPERGGP